MEKDHNGKPLFYKLRADFTVDSDYQISSWRRRTSYHPWRIDVDGGIFDDDDDWIYDWIFGRIDVDDVFGRIDDGNVDVYKCVSDAPFPPLSGWICVHGHSVASSYTGFSVM